MAATPSHEAWKRAYQFLVTRSVPRMSEELKQSILANQKQKIAKEA